MTSITLSTQYGNYTISLEQDEMCIDAVITDLINPLLLAAGYQPNSIREWIPEGV